MKDCKNVRAGGWATCCDPGDKSNGASGSPKFIKRERFKLSFYGKITTQDLRGGLDASCITAEAAGTVLL